MMKQQSKKQRQFFGVALLTILVVLSNGFINSGNGSLVKAQESGSDGTSILPIIATPTVLAIDSSNAANLYAGTINGVFKSSDSGASWRQVGLRGLYVSTLTIAPSDPNILYAGIYPTGNCNEYTNRVFKSTNGGTGWQPLGAFTYLNGCEEILAVAVAPSNPNVLYVSIYSEDVIPTLARSDDGGNNFVELSGFYFPVVAVDSYNPYTVYVGTYGYEPNYNYNGLYKSANGGFDLTNIALAGYGISALTLDPRRRGIRAPFEKSRTIYAAANIYLASSGEIFQGLFKSVSGAWFTINNGLESLIGTSNGIRSLVIDPNNPDILYVGTNGSGVFQSTDGGASWTPFNIGLPNLSISSLAITNDTSAILYAIAGDSIFKFINNRWVRLPDLIVPPPPGPIPGSSGSPKGN